MRLGAMIADVPMDRLYGFIPFGFRAGVAFQIQDDVLNLTAEEALYGKELNGDIAEGKWSLIIIHTMAHVSVEERAAIAAIYAKNRVDKTPEDIALVRGAMARTG